MNYKESFNRAVTDGTFSKEQEGRIRASMIATFDAKLASLKKDLAIQEGYILEQEKSAFTSINTDTIIQARIRMEEDEKAIAWVEEEKVKLFGKDA